MTIEPPRRRRRHPDELRSEAVGAARDILERFGPAAITLQSVAGALGMAHGSITHHFGTAANLQAAVADVLIEQLKQDEAIAEADTLLLTVPNQLGVDYNVHVIEAILKHVAPGLGWR